MRYLIPIILIAVIGCSSAKFELADGTKYERWNNQELSDIEIYAEKADGTKIYASMGAQKSDPEKIKEILEGISKIIEELKRIQTP